MCLSKKAKNQFQKTTVATSVATKKDQKGEIGPSVPTTSTIEIEISRKTRDKLGLKQASRAWYESLTKYFD